MANVDVVALAKRFAPILYFHPQERFFPCDAKRYIEHCSLWKAHVPFDDKDSWERAVSPESIVASNAEPTEAGQVYLSDAIIQSDGNQQGRELFFELAGWKDSLGVNASSKNSFSNRDLLKALYDDNPRLSGSKFWYHAELLDAAALRDLVHLGYPKVSGYNLESLVLALLPTNPALLCYYLFYPAHDESLAGPCAETESGREVASFSGEWECIAILLSRPDDVEEYKPHWIGVTGREAHGTSQAFVSGSRVGMTVIAWPSQAFTQTPEPNRIDDHPILWVATGTHSLFFTPTTGKTFVPDPIVPLSGACGQVDFGPAIKHGDPDAPPDEPIEPDREAALSKVLGGFAIAQAAGFLAGLVAAGLEGNLGWGIGITGGGPPSPDTPAPDITASPGALGVIVCPPGLETAVSTREPSGAVQPWTSDAKVEIEGRYYTFIVDRESQLWWTRDWWPYEAANPGFQGRWGPQVVDDPYARRSGMHFPDFWRLFLVGLAMLPTA
jgi:hypothetical protein